MLSPHAVMSAALEDVSDVGLPRSHRVQAAHLVAYLHPVLHEDEALTADVLTVATRELPFTAIAQTLVVGVWRAYGDDPRVATWTRRLVERACERDERLTAAVLADLLSWMEGFDGRLSDAVARTLTGAASDPNCHWPLFNFAYQVETRLGPDALPGWVAQLRNDPRILHGVAIVRRSAARLCPVCKLVPLHYFPREPRRDFV